jgi:hypothetical protein
MQRNLPPKKCAPASRRFAPSFSQRAGLSERAGSAGAQLAISVVMIWKTTRNYLTRKRIEENSDA